MKISFIVNTSKSNNVGTRVRTFITHLKETKAVKTDVAYFSEDYFYVKIARLFSLIISDIDIVHIFEPFGPSFLFLPLYKLKGTKIIYQSGDLHSGTGDLTRSKTFLTPVSRLSEFLHYRLADQIIVANRGAPEILSKMYHIPVRHFCYIPFWPIYYNEMISLTGEEVESLEQSKMQNEWKSNETRIQNTEVNVQWSKQSSRNPIVLLYSASLRVLYFNNQVVPRGWEIPFIINYLNKRSRTKIRAVILGDGEGLKLLRDLAVQLRVDNQIEFDGIVSGKDYFNKLHSADLCFVESLEHVTYDIMNPTKIADYLAEGKPFICGKSKETQAWGNYSLTVSRPKISDRFYEDNKWYIEEVCGLIEKFAYDRAFRAEVYQNLNVIQKLYPTWKSLSEKIYNIYQELVLSN